MHPCMHNLLSLYYTSSVHHTLQKDPIAMHIIKLEFFVGPPSSWGPRLLPSSPCLKAGPDQQSHLTIVK